MPDGSFMFIKLSACSFYFRTFDFAFYLIGETNYSCFLNLLQLTGDLHNLRASLVSIVHASDDT